MASKQKSSSPSPNREEMLQLAIDAAKHKQMPNARLMFRRILNEDPNNERAIMWLAKIANTKEERRQWLERALDINPNNEQALKHISQMEHQEKAERNRLFLRLGIVAYVIGLFVLTLLILFIVTR